MQLLIALGSMVVMAVIAAKKGFNPLFWILAGGIPGLVVLSCMPSAKADGIDDEARRARARKGNTVGGVISGIAVALGIVLFAVVASL